MSDYPCGVCGREFARKENLDRHIRRHTNEKPFKCIICSLSFSRIDYLHDHIREHTGERLFKCYICKKLFNGRGYLKVHLKSHSNLDRAAARGRRLKRSGTKGPLGHQQKRTLINENEGTQEQEPPKATKQNEKNKEKLDRIQKKGVDPQQRRTRNHEGTKQHPRQRKQSSNEKEELDRMQKQKKIVEERMQKIKILEHQNSIDQASIEKLQEEIRDRELSLMELGIRVDARSQVPSFD